MWKGFINDPDIRGYQHVDREAGLLGFPLLRIHIFANASGAAQQFRNPALQKLPIAYSTIPTSPAEAPKPARTRAASKPKNSGGRLKQLRTNMLQLTVNSMCSGAQLRRLP